MASWKQLYLLVIVLLVACTSEPAIVEVTREVTRIVEVPVEVTRIVEVVATGVPETTDEDQACDQFKSTMSAIIVRWNDAIDLAESTQRINLSTNIAELQQIRRDLMGVVEPECVQVLGVKATGVAMMDRGIDIFTSFLGERPNETDKVFYSIENDLFADALDAME